MVELNDPASFVDEENWRGGYYELSLELGGRDDRRLDLAVRRLWSDEQLEGCYVDRGREPTQQPRIEPTLDAQRRAGDLRGLATLPDGARVVCGSAVTRIDDEGVDSLTLYLPVGALARADRRVGAYPFGSMATVGAASASRESLVWRQPIDGWLSATATAVHAVAPFRLGLIGFEVACVPGSAEFARVPDERFETYLVPRGERVVVHHATM